MIRECNDKFVIIWSIFGTAKIVSLGGAKLQPLFLVGHVHFRRHAFQSRGFWRSTLVCSSSWNGGKKIRCEFTFLYFRICTVHDSYRMKDVCNNSNGSIPILRKSEFILLHFGFSYKIFTEFSLSLIFETKHQILRLNVFFFKIWIEEYQKSKT